MSILRCTGCRPQYYEVASQTGEAEPADSRLWAVAGVNKVWDDQFGADLTAVQNLCKISRYSDCTPCSIPPPNTIQVLDNEDTSRNVKVQYHASGSAFIARNMDKRPRQPNPRW